jgi:hypothetical protein
MPNSSQKVHQASTIGQQTSIMAASSLHCKGNTWITHMRVEWNARTPRPVARRSPRNAGAKKYTRVLAKPSYTGPHNAAVGLVPAVRGGDNPMASPPSVVEVAGPELVPGVVGASAPFEYADTITTALPIAEPTN